MTGNSITTGYNLADSQDRDDRRKHLELVSGVVGRMATASAAAKGWSITLAGAAFGVAFVRGQWCLIVLGIVALVMFGIVDGLYLHNEKRFRDLYTEIADQNSIKPLSMDLTVLASRKKRKSLASWSVLGFYGPLIVLGLILLTIAVINIGHSAPIDGSAPSLAPTITVSTATVTVTKTVPQTPPAAAGTAVPTPPSSPAPTPPPTSSTP